MCICAENVADLIGRLGLGLLALVLRGQLVCRWMMDVMIHEGHQVLSKPAASVMHSMFSHSLLHLLLASLFHSFYASFCASFIHSFDSHCFIDSVTFIHTLCMYCHSHGEESSKRYKYAVMWVTISM